LSNFNDVTYEQWRRDWVLLSLVYDGDRNLLTVELWPNDTIPPDGVKLAHELLATRSFFGDNFKWVILNPAQEDVMQRVPINGFYRKKVVRNADLFQDVKFQPLFLGETIGVVGIEADLCNCRTILVSRMPPIDLNPMMALVTEALQTRLCHVALLCNNRKTPNMALADAASVFSPSENQIVRFTVRQSGSEMAPATEDEEAVWLAGRNSRKVPITLKADFEYDGIEQQREINRRNWRAIGSKAENLLLVMSAIGGKINNTVNELAFVIPFHYFRCMIGPVDAEPLALRG
jgi:hypothetical protein